MGYVQFAFNAVELVADATNYFELFFHFNERFAGKDPLFQYRWDVEPNQFEEVGTIGFSATVWITTADLQTPDDAWQHWSEALDELTDYLCEQRALPLQLKPIYGKR